MGTGPFSGAVAGAGAEVGGGFSQVAEAALDGSNATDFLWNVATALPVVGNALSAGPAVADVYALATANNPEERGAATRALYGDAMGAMVPKLLGPNLVYDVLSSNQSSGELMDEFVGGGSQSDSEAEYVRQDRERERARTQIPPPSNPGCVAGVPTLPWMDPAACFKDLY